MGTVTTSLQRKCASLVTPSSRQTAATLQCTSASRSSVGPGSTSPGRRSIGATHRNSRSRAILAVHFKPVRSSVNSPGWSWIGDIATRLTMHYSSSRYDRASTLPVEDEVGLRRMKTADSPEKAD
ncbi:hypothetical protein JYU34_016405 [Plutella xylostella]|uniref:Uncharacterized protein n=1 Tax=Plutella xylostella TaxID=51655 RepID=A0ABQ7Q2N4_PLUXY|nr:hypothetical protein JYU34_016405 [Plutella xylostella]